jgi:hypothetical protein
LQIEELGISSKLANKIDAYFIANPNPEVKAITTAQLQASAQLTVAERARIDDGMVGQMALGKGWKTSD